MIEVHPNKANAYRERGSAYSDKGLQQKAIDDYSQAIKLEPKNFAFSEAGATYLLQGLGEKAIADYNQAVKLTPNCYSRYWSRAIAYNYLDRNQKAIEDCNQAIRLEREQPLYSFGQCCMLAWTTTKKLLADCNKAISLIFHNQYKYEYAKLYDQRAEVYRKMGNYSKALADCDKAISCEPYVTSTFLTGKAAQCSQGRAADRGYLYRVFNKRHYSFRARTAWSRSWRLNRAINFNPKCARSYAIRASIYIKLGLKKKANDDIRTARTLDSAQLTGP